MLKKVVLPMVFVLLFLGTTPYLMIDVFATFPGNNGKIAFDVRGDSFSVRDVWVMDPDGSDKQNISNSPNSFDGDAYCSADGTKFVFESTRDGGSRQIYLMGVDGSNPTNISDNEENDGSPGWSPDGTKVVFESDRTGDREIWIMDANGDNPQQLTDNGFFNGNPNWSPDGTKIVYVSSFSFDIIVMNAADGSGKTTIGTGDNPDWSPDSSQIVFDFQGGIWVMDANGDNPQQLNDNGRNPNWSPDGTMIVFDRFTQGPRQIFVMESNGDNPTNISNDDETNSRPHWCPIVPQPPQVPVGGEFLPIEQTALILAGAQSFSWMIPVVLSVLGIGLFVIRRSENSG